MVALSRGCEAAPAHRLPRHVALSRAALPAALRRHRRDATRNRAEPGAPRRTGASREGRARRRRRARAPRAWARRRFHRRALGHRGRGARLERGRRSRGARLPFVDRLQRADARSRDAMTEAASFLLLPALACIALVGIHAYFGLQVLERNVIFVDLALAQVAALGATVAFLVGHPPQGLAAHGYALAFTLAAAAFLAATGRWSTRLPQEAQIGVLYVVAAAAALLAVDRAPQGAEHIRQILTGNILTVGWEELRWAVPLYAIVGAAYPLAARALEKRWPGRWAGEFAFYAAFGLVVTSSVALAGVLLVFAFLIIPAAIGVLHASTLARQLAIGWTAGTLTSGVGLAASFVLDLPTGATMVCAFGAGLALAGLAYPFLRGSPAHALKGSRAALRWCAALLLAASAVALVFAPRSDQPLIDAVEY